MSSQVALSHVAEAWGKATMQRGPAAQVRCPQQSFCALQSSQATLGRRVRQLSCSNLSPPQLPCQPSVPWLQVTKLVLLSLLLYVWRQIPYIGRLAAPVMHFFTMQRNLGHQRALALSAVGLVPWLEPVVVRSACGKLCCHCLPYCALACSTQATPAAAPAPWHWSWLLLSSSPGCLVSQP